MRPTTLSMRAATAAQLAVGVREQLTAELAGLQYVTLIASAGKQYRTTLRDVP